MGVRSRLVVAAAFVAMLLLTAVSSSAQVLIKVSDDVNFKLGVLGQVQADDLDTDAAGGDTKNLFIRRLRLLFGGQVAKNVTFFIETDAPNLGKTLPSGKNIQPSIFLQDAYGELKVSDAFSLDAGLMYVPFSRNAIQSGATLLPIDYSAYTFSDTQATQSVVGRDTGFQAKGYFAGNRLEYRLGVFQGARDAKSQRQFRYAGRVQYNFFDPEVGFFYTGTYLGKKKVVAVGAAFDRQDEYRAFDADAFVDYPAGPGAVTAQVDVTRFDGRTTFTTLPRQNDVLVELAYFIRDLKLSPVVQLARRDVVDTSVGDEDRLSFGANYWWAGHNANIKAAYTRINPSGATSQNEYTIQLQFFYF